MRWRSVARAGSGAGEARATAARPLGARHYLERTLVAGLEVARATEARVARFLATP